MDDERMMKLEEAVLFCERRVEELAEQVLALSGRVEMLADRVGAVETLVGRAMIEGEPPELDGAGPV